MITENRPTARGGVMTKVQLRVEIYNEIRKCVECGRDLEKLKEPFCVLTKTVEDSTDRIVDLVGYDN